MILRTREGVIVDVKSPLAIVGRVNIDATDPHSVRTGQGRRDGAFALRTVGTRIRDPGLVLEMRS